MSAYLRLPAFAKRLVLAAMLMLGAGQAALAGYRDATYCVSGGSGVGTPYCDGYNGRSQCYNLGPVQGGSDDYSRECMEGWSARQEITGKSESRAEAQQMAEEERERRALLRAPPLAAATNPLLGHWRRAAAGAAARGLLEGLAGALTETVCGQLQGAGPSFEFRADALAHGGRPVSPMQYRAGPNRVVYAFGEREPMRQLAFRFQGNDRMTLSSCAFERLGAGTSVATAGAAAPRVPEASATPAPRAGSASRPPAEVCQRTFVDKLGAVSLDTVRKALPTRFRETLTGVARTRVAFVWTRVAAAATTHASTQPCTTSMSTACCGRSLSSGRDPPARRPHRSSASACPYSRVFTRCRRRNRRGACKPIRRSGG